MTKPSRKDFEQALFEKLIWATGDKPAVKTRTFLPIEWAAILEALRIAADQMTEREKVVAWLLTLKDTDPVIVQLYADLGDAIERGDHSTATPVSAPDDRWPEAPRDEDWYRAEEVSKSVDCWIYQGGETHVVNTYARAFAALRMTEREKVVAWHRERGARARKNFDDRTYIFHDMCADAIERGDHSTATPVSGWRSMDSAPRDGTWFLGVEMSNADGGNLSPCVVARWRGPGRWLEAGFYNDATRRLELVGWQPLPSPPGGGT